MSTMACNYIYLLQEREFIKTNENIAKVGRTSKENLTRFYQYPKGSKLILQSDCEDCKKCEKIIIQMFKILFIQRDDIGLEYFEGDFNEMKKIINKVIEHESTAPNKNAIEFIHDDTNYDNKTKNIEYETLGNGRKTEKYFCKICDYNTSRKSSIYKHFLTDKHRRKSANKLENRGNMPTLLL